MYTEGNLHLPVASVYSPILSSACTGRFLVCFVRGSRISHFTWHIRSKAVFLDWQTNCSSVWALGALLVLLCFYFLTIVWSGTRAGGWGGANSFRKVDLLIVCCVYVWRFSISRTHIYISPFCSACVCHPSRVCAVPLPVSHPLTPRSSLSHPHCSSAPIGLEEHFYLQCFISLYLDHVCVDPLQSVLINIVFYCGIHVSVASFSWRCLWWKPKCVHLKHGVGVIN